MAEETLGVLMPINSIDCWEISTILSLTKVNCSILPFLSVHSTYISTIWIMLPQIRSRTTPPPADTLHRGRPDTRPRPRRMVARISLCVQMMHALFALQIPDSPLFSNTSLEIFQPSSIRCKHCTLCAALLLSYSLIVDVDQRQWHS